MWACGCVCVAVCVCVCVRQHLHRHAQAQSHISPKMTAEICTPPIGELKSAFANHASTRHITKYVGAARTRSEPSTQSTVCGASEVSQLIWAVAAAAAGAECDTTQQVTTLFMQIIWSDRLWGCSVAKCALQQAPKNITTTKWEGPKSPTKQPQKASKRCCF